MEDKDIDFFKKLLNKHLAELLGLANLTINNLLDDVDKSPDPLDRASLESERIQMLLIRDRESKLIRKIKKSLQSLEDGTFGICEVCEEEISIERLKARPVTSHCIACKTKMEAQERAYK
jgi:DnaK suppressor protein